DDSLVHLHAESPHASVSFHIQPSRRKGSAHESSILAEGAQATQALAQPQTGCAHAKNPSTPYGMGVSGCVIRILLVALVQRRDLSSDGLLRSSILASDCYDPVKNRVALPCVFRAQGGLRNQRNRTEKG